MDNEAFSSLVKGRAGIKSSKEIAREAVEEEFSRRCRSGGKKRRRGGGGDDDELSSDGEQDDKPQRGKSRRDEECQSFQPRTVVSKSKTDADEATSTYRDRAKERREGINVDYRDSQQLLESVEEATGLGENVDPIAVSKVLGGDEAHTHLVKGLDVTLARSAKRQRNREDSGKADEVGDFLAQMKTASQAKVWLDSNPQIDSSLGHDMLEYLRYQYGVASSETLSSSEVSPAGLAAQRSTITFSLCANTRDVLRAWEIPNEQTYAAHDSSQYAKASTLDSDLLERIERKLDASGLKVQTTTSTRASGKTSAGTGNKSEHAQINDGDDDESDEDIFASVGDDYKLDDEASDQQSDGEQRKVGASLFDHDGSKTSGPVASKEADRIGTVEAVDEVLRNADGRVTACGVRLSGLSSSYGGGYGEDVDMDFDGRLEDDDEDDKSAKKKRKKRNKKQDDDKAR